MPPEPATPVQDSAGPSGGADGARLDRAHRATLARRRRSRNALLHRLGTYGALSVGALLVLFPMYVLVNDSLLQPSQLIANPPVLFPNHPAWHNFRDVVVGPAGLPGFGLYLRNSVIQTTIIVVAQLVTSVLAAYAFVFLRFPLRRVLFMVVLGTLMIPFEVTVTGNYHLIRALGWDGSFLGLTIPFFATGFGIFLMRQAFLGIPPELREAAVLEGYGPMRFLWRIALPLTRPVIAALAVFSFLGAWNQYLWPALITNTPQGQNLATVQIGLLRLSGSSEFFGYQLAGGIIAFAPLVVLLVFFRKNLIRSLTAGAVK
jgi:sn-glycerol 3-phosphate transport system permease protein